jgi:hypothetical protein
MGVASGPSYATIYFAVNEASFSFEELFYYTRYLDDIFGIWVPRRSHDDKIFECFQRRMKFGRLLWDFSKRTDRASFLDMDLSIGSDGKIHSRCVEKVLNLHLYIPPHSAHPPNILRGQIRGTLLRIRRLTTDPAIAQSLFRDFFLRLLRRGHSKQVLSRLFAEAESPSPSNRASSNLSNSLFLHVKYHPLDPRRRTIQDSFSRFVLQPHGKIALPDVKNHNGVPFVVNKLTVAYHRAPNLRDKIARTRHRSKGTPASALFMRLQAEGASNPHPDE